MLNNLKNFKSVIALSIVCIFLCILTFLAFINPKLLFFSDVNLHVLLILDIILLILFLSIIFKKSYNLYHSNKKKKQALKPVLDIFHFLLYLLLYHLFS